MFVHFEKNNIINKKIVVTAIWVFSLFTIVLLLAITYQELISERLTHSNSMVDLKTLVGVGLGILLISGLLLESKFARQMVLLFAYISLLSPFMIYIMLKVFIPDFSETLFSLLTVPNIIMSLLIIYLLSNDIALRLYLIRRKKRIKEQLYLIVGSIFLIGIYIYYIHIPLLIESTNL